ncbi:MAG: hypothetical protein J1E43_08750 [Christensenellaceae bacterium]|nr:hypothetical protein [Christensenellaceae bacterium]
MRKLAALLLALMMMSSATALAEMNWPKLTTAGQEQLRDYISRVNGNMTVQGQPAVNSIFEFYETFATMGVTSADNADIPESVELTFLLSADGPQTLQLRVSDAGRFAAIAAACVQASSPTAIALETALTETTQFVQQTLSEPYTIIEDTVNVVQGASPRVYYAYYPNQYSDGVDWRQLTLVFPLPGSEDAPVAVTPEPAVALDADSNEVYSMNTRTYEEEYQHLEVFLTPTPEPDSAANEP